MASDGKNSNANEQIRENLRRVYEEALEDEFPQEFIELIERLADEKSAGPDDR